MSFQALRHVAGLTGLTPLQKLVLTQIAYFHNHNDDRCFPSVGRLAAYTGLSHTQVTKTIKSLTSARLLSHNGQDYLIAGVGPDPLAMPVPDDWWPSEDTIQAILTAYPTHRFEMEAAVHDFIAFCRRKNIRFAPNRVDPAFFRNITALLDLNGPEQDPFADRSSGTSGSSVGHFLAGLD